MKLHSVIEFCRIYLNVSCYTYVSITLIVSIALMLADARLMTNVNNDCTKHKIIKRYKCTPQARVVYNT